MKITLSETLNIIKTNLDSGVIASTTVHHFIKPEQRLWEVSNPKVVCG